MGKRVRREDEEEQFLPSFMRRWATRLKLDFLLGRKVEDAWVGHLQLKETMKEGSVGSEFEVR